jgi:hypothetical protein
LHQYKQLTLKMYKYKKVTFLSMSKNVLWLK